MMYDKVDNKTRDNLLDSIDEYIKNNTIFNLIYGCALIYLPEGRSKHTYYWEQVDKTLDTYNHHKKIFPKATEFIGKKHSLTRLVIDLHNNYLINPRKRR